MSRVGGTRLLPLGIGQGVSELGSSMSRLALPVVAILAFAATPVQVGLVTAVQFLAYTVAAPAAGTLFDRRPSARWLLSADLLRAAATVAAALLIVAGFRHIALLVLLSALLGGADAVFVVGFRTITPLVIPQEDLLRANGLLVGGATLGEFAGQGVGGAILQVAGSAAAFACDAITYVVSFVSLVASGFIATAIPPLERPPGGYREAFGAIARDAGLWRATAAVAAIHVAGSMVQVAVLLLIFDHLKLSPGVAGLIFSAGAAGSVLGVALSGSAARRAGASRLVAVATLVFAAGCALPLAAAGWWAVPLLTLAFTLFSGALGLASVTFVTLRQTRPPRALLGRVNALITMLLVAALGAGSVLGGVLSSSNPRAAIAAAVVIALAGALAAASAPAATAEFGAAEAPFLVRLESMIELTQPQVRLMRWDRLLSDRVVDESRLRSMARGPRRQ